MKDRYTAKLISLSKLTAVRQLAAQPLFQPQRPVKVSHLPACLSYGLSKMQPADNLTGTGLGDMPDLLLFDFTTS